METRMGIVILVILVFSISVPVAFAEESDVEPDKSKKDGNRKMLICFNDDIDKSSLVKDDFIIEYSSYQSLIIVDVISGEPYHTKCLTVKFDQSIKNLGIELVYDDKNKSLLDMDGKEIQGFKITKKQNQRGPSDWFEIIHPYTAIPADPTRPLFQPNSKISYDELNNQSNLSWDFSSLNEDKCLLSANVYYRESGEGSSTSGEYDFIRNVIPKYFSSISDDSTKIDKQQHRHTIAEKIPCVGSFMIDWNTMINSPINIYDFENITMDLTFYYDGNQFLTDRLDNIEIVYAPETKIKISDLIPLCINDTLGSTTNILKNGNFIIDNQLCSNTIQLHPNQWYSFEQLILDVKKNHPDYGDPHPGSFTTSGIHNDTFQILFEIIQPIIPITAPIDAYTGALNQIVISFNGTFHGPPSFSEASGIFTTNNPDLHITQTWIEGKHFIIDFDAPILRSEFNLIYHENKHIRDVYDKKILGFMIIKEWKEIDANSFGNFFTIIYPYPAISVDPPIEEEKKKKGNGGCSDCTPPTIGLDNKGTRLVDDGLVLNGETFDVEYFKTHMPMQYTEIGKENHLQVKVYENQGAYNIRMVQLAMGLKEIGTPLSQAQALLEIEIENFANDVDNPSILETNLIDKDEIIRDYKINPSLVQCMDDSNQECLQLDIYWTYDKITTNPVLALNGWDTKRNSFTDYFNDGLTVIDPNPVTILEPIVTPTKECKMYKVTTRDNICQFQSMIEFEKERALLVFDSSMIK